MAEMKRPRQAAAAEPTRREQVRCPECDRLWQEYARATREFEELKRRQEGAAALNRTEEFVSLEQTIEAALEAQKRAWLDVDRHQTWSHGAEVADA